jgi:hypothetical protein
MAFTNPFYDSTGTEINQQDSLRQILDVGKYEDLNALDKASIILDNSLNSWRDVTQGVEELFSDEVEDRAFKRELGNKGNLELAREHQININNIPALRVAKNQDDFNRRLEAIKEREKREREAGLVSEGSTLWASVNIATNILTDPLLIPSIILPELALSRFNAIGTMGRFGVGATIDMGLYGAFDSLSFLATQKQKDIGDTIGELLLSGFLGGATSLIDFKDVRAVKETKDNLIDWTTRRFELPNSKPHDIVVSSIVGKPMRFSTDLKANRTDIIRRMFSDETWRQTLKDLVGDRLEGKDYKRLADFSKSDYIDVEIVEGTTRKLIGYSKKNKASKKEKYKKPSLYKDYENYKEHPLRDLVIDLSLMSKKERNNQLKIMGLEGEDIKMSKSSILRIMEHKPTNKDIEEYIGNIIVLESMMEFTPQDYKPRYKNIKSYQSGGIIASDDGLFMTKEELKKYEGRELTEDEVRELFKKGGLGAVTAVLIGSNEDLFAGDGADRESPLDVLAVLAIGVLGIKYRKGISDILQRAKEKAKSPKNLIRETFGIVGGTKGYFEKLNSLSDEAFKHTKTLGKILTDNLHSLMERGAEEGAGDIKETIKARFQAELFSKLAPIIEDYKKVVGFKSLNPLKHMKFREEFYNTIGRAYTKGDFSQLSEHHLKAKKAFDKFYDDIYKAMVDANVDGMKSIRKIKDYFPRFHNPHTYDLVAQLSKADRERVVKWYGEAIKRGFKREFGKDIDIKDAEKYAKQLLAYGKSDKFIKAMKEDELFTPNEVENVDDFFNRAKFRIPIDFNIKPLVVGGKRLEMVDFVDTNAFSVMNRYSNIALGHYAFGVKGITNITNYLKRVENEFKEHGGDIDLLRDIKDYANMILGKPVTDIENKRLWDFFNLLRQATVAQLLHLSGISALQELIPASARALMNGSFGKSFKAFRELAKGEFSKMPNRVREMAQELGYGYHRVLASEHLKNPLYYMEDFTIGGKLVDTLDRILTAQQRITFFFNQLPALDDLANLFNLEPNLNRLKDHFKGNRLNKRRLETLGLTPDKEKILRGAFKKIDDNSMNFDKWTKEEREVFRATMKSFQTSWVGKPNIGDMPLFIIRNPLLKSLMTLLSFPVQSFDNLLLRDLYSFDSESIFKFQMMFVSTSIALTIRDFVNQREEKKDEVFIERVVGALPHIALLQMANDIFNPNRETKIGNVFPVLGVLENAVNAPHEALGGEYKNLLQVMSVPLFMGKLITEYAKEPQSEQERIEALNATIGGLK